jgi:hypothetical protein
LGCAATTKVLVDCFTDDGDATLTLSGDIGGRFVELTVGDNQVDVDVVACDGKTKKTCVRVGCLARGIALAVLLPFSPP